MPRATPRMRRGPRRPAGDPRRSGRGEDGQILLLGVGVIAVVAALVLVVASATAVHLDLKTLTSLADSAAAAAVDGFDRRADIGAARLHIVIGADRDGPHLLLRSDDMLHRGDEFVRKAPMRHEHQADKLLTKVVHCPVGCPSSASCGAAARSRWATVGENPALRNRSATRSAICTDRCLPPVQPNAIVT